MELWVLSNFNSYQCFGSTNLSVPQRGKIIGKKHGYYR